MCGSRRAGHRTPTPKPPRHPRAGPRQALTQHICRPVPGHEAGVVPVAHAFLEDALAEIFAKATAGCHQAVVTGVRLREAAQDCPGHQPAIGEHREHGVGRPAAQSQERGEPPAQPPPDLRPPAAGSQPSPARRPACLSRRCPSSARPLALPPPLRPGSRPRPRRPRLPLTPRAPAPHGRVAGSAPAFRAAAARPPPRGGLCLFPGRPALPRKGLRAPSRLAVGWSGQSRRCPLRRPRTPPAAAAIFPPRVLKPRRSAKRAGGEVSSAPPSTRLRGGRRPLPLAPRRASFACCGTITPGGSQQPPRRGGAERGLPPSHIAPR